MVILDRILVLRVDEVDDRARLLLECGEVDSSERSRVFGLDLVTVEALRCLSRELGLQKLVLANCYRKLDLTYSTSHSCYLLPSPPPPRPRPRG